MGLRCALPHDELCIGRCYFEKCNYLSDKADGPVLSGICCTFIKSLVLETGLPAHKHECVDRFRYASINIHMHMEIHQFTHLKFIPDVLSVDTSQTDIIVALN